MAGDLGPVSAFVRAHPGFKLVAAITGRGLMFFVFACGPDRADGRHDHFRVAPGFDSSRPNWRAIR